MISAEYGNEGSNHSCILINLLKWIEKHVAFSSWNLIGSDISKLQMWIDIDASIE